LDDDVADDDGDDHARRQRMPAPTGSWAEIVAAINNLTAKVNNLHISLTNINMVISNDKVVIDNLTVKLKNFATRQANSMVSEPDDRITPLLLSDNNHGDDALLLPIFFPKTS
jgi:hypothetical protein